MGGGYEDSLKMDPDGMGIIPRIVLETYNMINERENCTFEVSVSYLEVSRHSLPESRKRPVGQLKLFTK